MKKLSDKQKEDTSGLLEYLFVEPYKHKAYEKTIET